MVITVYDKFNRIPALENAILQPNSVSPGQSVPLKFSIGYQRIIMIDTPCGHNLTSSSDW